MSSSAQFKRLATNVVPVNYGLELTPDLVAFNFSGHVSIDVIINSATDTIQLNSVELTLGSIYFEHSNGSRLESSRVDLSVETEVASIYFSENLVVGTGRLHIDFSGELNDRLKGFYRIKTVLPNGESRYSAATQFEAADARRAFPSWDEPAFKASFDITIFADKHKTVLSNMPLASSTPVEGDLHRFHFERTPIMSTYLVAFIVGDYDYVEERDRNGVLVRVYTPLGKAEQGRFALDISVKTLPFYNDYFRLAYPLPKLDLIAVPELSFGAMENWGLVTYRENALLFDKNNSSIMAKQRVAMIVGHELAHQWFGNIVTMEWWTHLWLNEGFASWIEYLSVDHCLPELDIWTHFVNSDYCRALELDSLKNSHPIEVPVGPPSEVDEIFDAISYSKGASAIRMLHNYIGDEAFRTGLHNYLEKFKYKNAETEDLWEALSATSQKPVKELMDSWVKQTGYPYLSVCRRVNEKNETILSLKQERFFSNGAKPTAAENYLWKVPISIVTKSSYPDVHTHHLLEKQEDEVNLGVLRDCWIKLNKNSVGLYRTSYSPGMLQDLVGLVREQTLHPTDRLGLQSDVFALSQAGLLPAGEVLWFVEGYAAEENVTVWQDLISNLLGFSRILLNTNFHGEFQSFVCRLLRPVSQKLGWDPVQGETGLKAMCRATILRALGLSGDQETINEAKRRFEAHRNGKLIPADLRSAVYASVLYDADESDLNEFIDLHNNSDLQEEKMRIATSLGAVRKEPLIRKILEFALSSSVRSQDSVSVICSVAENCSTRLSSDLTWQFTKQNWPVIFSRFSSGFLMPRLVKSVTEVFASQGDYEDIERFFNANPIPIAQRSIQQGLESIQVNMAWLNRNEKSLNKYLTS